MAKMSDAINPDAPKPRLCHLKKTTDFVGYGFNLHAEKGKAGQYIGAIDPGSPAERAGLKPGDRIVEVNGTNIGNENHQQVVQRIKSVDDETRLLVVDPETDQFYKDNKIVVRGDLPNVQYISSDLQENGNIPGDEGPTSDNSLADGPTVRHCVLRIWPDFQGYGFNLHAEKGKPGQFIGKVDDDSPAQYAGLQEGDRLVEVNGDSVISESHAQVVQKIKSVPNQVELLVVDAAADEYYKEQGINLHSGLPMVQKIESPAVRPEQASSNGSATAIQADIVNNTAEMHIGNEDDEDMQQSQAELADTIEAAEKAIVEEEKEAVTTFEEDKEEMNNNQDVADNYETVGNVDRDEPAPPPFEDNKEDYEPVDLSANKETAKTTVVVETKPPVEEPPQKSQPSAPEPAVQPTTPESPTVIAGIEFASSAAAAREKIQGRKKRDAAKSQNISAKDKYDMFLKL